MTASRFFNWAIKRRGSVRCQSGGSDAIIVNPGLGPVLKERGNSILADFTELPIAYPQQTMSIRERTIKIDPEFVERALKGIVAGNGSVSTRVTRNGSSKSSPSI